MKKKDKTAAQLQLVCQIQILLREELLDPDPTRCTPTITSRPPGISILY